MKLRFEADLEYQADAIDAVCGLFTGQEICRTEFTVTSAALGGQAVLGPDQVDTGLGIGNRLALGDGQLLANLNVVQARHSLAPSEELPARDFTVEMETGTGKTYVYLRTVFELNKRYGFTKFVIVVPSIAIKAGVYKTLQITRDHFRALYSGIPYDYFLYDSAKLGNVRNFATSSQIQIMVMTVGAINKKDTNNLYKDTEKTGGDKPIDLIRATNPIVIVDEPQSVDGGLKGAGRKALDGMNPLCTLRYSATHVDKHAMVYRLDAVDAYEQELVKQIEVASATIQAAHNRPYIKLLSTSGRGATITASVELDVVAAGGKVSRRAVTVRDGDDLRQTTRRDVYADISIGEIKVGRGRQTIEVLAPGDARWLAVGESIGDVDPALLHREMIRRTIREHLDKQLRLRDRGVKVLSLFFVPHVALYREYTDEGPVKGPYALIFEEEYLRLAKHPDYKGLFDDAEDLAETVEKVHNGYFSMDRSARWTDTAESNETGREAAGRAYDLIMKDKEKLLSLDTPLQFIFSHSALKEGWDNPNVFQICSLRDMSSEIQRRQTIGRGLRLCVDQNGDRLRGFDTNTLTVIATESYEDFAANLQREIEDDTGIRFGVVEAHAFAGIAVVDPAGAVTSLGYEKSIKLYGYLREEDYVTADGRIKASLREALRDDTLAVPRDFAGQRDAIAEVLKKLAGRLTVKDADERQQVKPHAQVLDSEEFQALWERIKHKTAYRVKFDNDKLIAECVAALRDAPEASVSTLRWRKATVGQDRAGIDTAEVEGAQTVRLKEAPDALPDLVTELQDRTHLTRRTIAQILTGSGRLSDFRLNPQEFISVAADAINRCKRLVLVDGIKYERLGADEYYHQTLFRTEELRGYVKGLIPATKAVYEQLVLDSGIERRSAAELETVSAVKVYAKLPGWFKVPTPLGPYNPDWAVLILNDEGERVYFVVETKGSMDVLDLRTTERGKIGSAKAHFDELAATTSTPPAASYRQAKTLGDIWP
ncbi:MAG: DEAD/DEAH box helicase family protein [Candidatus Nanopelagicales bacterium]|nr:DEAD/DEAH box helicase family protein [Candidatus Nanopelagicales bacterium]